MLPISSTASSYDIALDTPLSTLILVLSIGIKYSSAGAVNIHIGGLTLGLSGLATGALIGIILNMLLPEKKASEKE